MPADMVLLTENGRRCCRGGGGGGGGFRDDRELCRSAAADATTTEMKTRFGLFADDGSVDAEALNAVVVVGGGGRPRVEGVDAGGGDCSPAGRRLSSFAASLRSPLTPSGMSRGVDENSCGGGRNDGGGMVVRKSANMTECVAVPSSEHVAEIVGRQGRKTHLERNSDCIQISSTELCRAFALVTSSFL